MKEGKKGKERGLISEDRSCADVRAALHWKDVAVAVAVAAHHSLALYATP